MPIVMIAITTRSMVLPLKLSLSAVNGLLFVCGIMRIMVRCFVIPSLVTDGALEHCWRHGGVLLTSEFTTYRGALTRCWRPVVRRLLLCVRAAIASRS